MSRRKWRGYATFDVPDNKIALMTVCPGNPDQEGRRFRAIMEAAGATLDHLYIIQAADLGYHNLKRVVPKNEAADFARFRGEKWTQTHQPAIDEFMKNRCDVIPMSQIVDDSEYETRKELIRNIYNAGNNPVTAWFDYSTELDIETRANRKEKDGVIIEPWAIKESALDYLIDEYAMRSLMWKQFKLPEIYLGLAVTKPDLFQSQNTENSEIDLSIPPVLPIKMHEVTMIHDRRKGMALPVEADLPPYANALGQSLRHGRSAA